MTDVDINRLLKKKNRNEGIHWQYIFKKEKL